MYVVVGDGPERPALEKIVQAAGLPVVFTGEVTDDYLRAWYEVADVFVLTPEPDPVDVEGFGIVYLEAQAAGKPVIASDVGGVAEAVGEAGILVHSTTELVVALRSLLSDQHVRQRLGATGRARLAGTFTSSTQAATLRHYVN